MVFLLSEVGSEYLFITYINQVTVVTPLTRQQGGDRANFTFICTNNFNIAISEFCAQCIISVTFMDLETSIDYCSVQD